MILFKKKFAKRYLLATVGVVAGGIAGYFYWKFAGCNGTCTITSSPFKSTIYGAVVGGLIFSLFKRNNKETA